MSYENTKCPCGGRKERETPFCGDCEVAFANRPEMDIYLNPEYSREARRNANITLVILAHRRLPKTASRRLRIDA